MQAKNGTETKNVVAMGPIATYAEKQLNEVCLVRKRQCMERTNATFTKHLEKDKIRLNSAWVLQHSEHYQNFMSTDTVK